MNTDEHRGAESWQTEDTLHPVPNSGALQAGGIKSHAAINGHLTGRIQQQQTVLTKTWKNTEAKAMLNDRLTVSLQSKPNTESLNPF